MNDDPRIQHLLDQLLDGQATPEEVCASCPELLPVVRERWQQMCRLRDGLDALFPPSTEPAPHRPGGPTLPQIPGYEVEAVLGRGGMGVVFKARHLKLKRLVALKMLLMDIYASPDELARFRREAEAVAALRHPNIVQVHDAGEVGGCPYFTMEYVEGGSLAHRLAGQPQPPRRAAEVVATLASAVQFAHKSGFIHRDLKPSNVLVTAEGIPRIADFGLARSIATCPEVTRSGAVMGSPSYMAPEQALGRASAIGPAVDIYGLGGVLYEILTGQPPFEGLTASETIQKVISEEPVAPSRLNAQVPRDLETICLKCLHKNPARRYASAQDLADDLHRFVDGKPVLARPVGVVERAMKWVRRRPAAALLIGALLVLLGAAAGIGIWLHQQEAERQAALAQRERQAREAIEATLKRADDLRQEERWQDAQHHLTLTSTNLVYANSPLLEEKLRQAQSDCRIAARLEHARESNPLQLDGTVDYPQRAAEFRKAFQDVGLRIEDDVEKVADSLRASRIRAQLVAAIEDRAFVAFMLKDEPLVERLLQLARLADPEPLWRDRFRDGTVWKDRKQLLQLSDRAFTTSPAPSEHQLALLGLLLQRVGARSQSTRLLAEACRRQPKNFWVHREMAFALLMENRWLEAAGYFRVAVALRPDNAGAHEGLGMSLSHAGQTDQALTAYRRAIELSPKSAAIRVRLVEALASAGYWKDAEAECRRALEIDPTNYLAPFRLAGILSSHGRLDDAIRMCRTAAETASNSAAVYYLLGTMYVRAGRHEDAVTAFRKVNELKAINLLADKYLAKELTTLGRGQEAIDVLEAATARQPIGFEFPIELGKIYRSHGQAGKAAEVFQTVAKRYPILPEAWEGLAAALLDQGHFAEALKATKRLLALPAKDAQRRAQLRQLQLCEMLLAIADDLPAILAGKEQPANAVTLRALAEWCLKHKQLTATAAGFYAAAFAAQPALADDLEAGDRFDAACAAALAGCEVGADVAALSGEMRAALRQQAHGWLTADFNAWAARHGLGRPGDRTGAATALRCWQWNQDLAGVRDEQALARLPTDERQAWETLWAKVATLAARDPVAKLDEARAHVARREWDKAVKCYAERMELEPTDDGEIWFEYAATQLLTGDRRGFRRTCAHMLARCQTAPQMHPYLAARAYTLAPGSTDNWAQLDRVMAKERASNAAAFWAVTEQAALDFRAGHTQVAVTDLERSLAVDGRPGRAVLSWLWLALAHQKMGEPDDAHRWLDKAVNWLDQQGGQMPVETPEMGSDRLNWLEAHVLQNEAQARLR
jgi:serine/threonine-protein kinase